MGTLFIVSTPIGNLHDITLRAMQTLFSVAVIACEDTRRTGILLDSLASHTEEQTIRPRLISYYEQNELHRILEILSRLVQGENVALISDAGTPAISDPGFKLIRECIQAGIKVEAIPGPSAPLTALTVSGLPTDKFSFVGYPPRKPGHRMKFFESIKTAQESLKSTVILFESPHRLVQMLEELKNVFGDIDIVICRELTKVHEEIRREKLSASLTHFQKTAPKGEFVILFHL